MTGPSPYERQAWEQIQDWRVARGVPWRPAAAEGPFPDSGSAARITGQAFTGPAAGGSLARIIDALLPTLVSAMNDVAQWRVDPAARPSAGGSRPGVPVQHLDLQVIDHAVEPIRGRYVPAMAAQGAGAGALGAPGIFMDLPVLVLVNLRAVGEYGIRYGFDLTLLHERLWAGQVLAFSAGASQAARAAAMVNLRQVAAAITSGATWTELDETVLAHLLRQIAAALGIRLTRKRLGMLVPVLGAVVGGATNVRFTAGTCEAAYYLYRERFLLRRYGTAIAGQVIDVPPDAAGLLPPLRAGNGDGFAG
jgi:hypothetical protein